MKHPIDEWITKAESDFKVALTLAKAKETEFYNPICFHSQQCAEKYLKAFLQMENIHFPKIHDLLELLILARSAAPDLELIRKELAELNQYAVTFRYPGDDASKEDANEAIKAAKVVRHILR